MKILCLLSRCPYPLEKGDKLRAYHQIKEWSKKHEIHLFFVTWKQPNSQQIETLKPYCKSITYSKLNLFSFLLGIFRFVLEKKPLQCAFFYSKTAHKRFLKLKETLHADFVFCQLVRMTPYTRNLKGCKILDYQDAFSYGLYRRLQVAPWYLKALLRYEYGAMKRMENYVFSQFDIKTIISEQDRELISHPLRAEIKVLPNGVDTKYFNSKIRETKIQDLKHFGYFDIVFTGNMSYPPNEDAATFLVKEIYPLLKITHPNLRVLIAGAKPSRKVRALASSRVIVSGWMADIRLAYLSATVFVAPMRLGTGMQNKLLEAMSMATPCVTTPLVAKGLSMNMEEDSFLEICEAKPHVFAEEIEKLLSDIPRQKRMGEQAASYVQRNFSWAVQSDKIEQWIKDLRE